MKNAKHRITALILVLLTLLPTIAACSSDATDATDTTSADAATESTAVTEALDPLEARKLVDDELGNPDLGGYEFRIASSDGHGETLWIESETGDVIDDAVFQRNTTVEERFNCQIKLLVDERYDGTSAKLSTAILAGEDAYDIVSMHVVQLGLITTSDYFLNWYDIPHIDFDKPWWSPSTVNDLTYKGICTTAIGDMALSAFSAAYCVFYNKDLGVDYNFPDLYAEVNDGKWTIDYITELAKDIYVDLNSNGVVDLEEDRFGYLSDNSSNLNAYLWSFDNPVFRKNGDTLEYSYKTEKLTSLVSKLCDTFNLHDGIKTHLTYVDPNGVANGYSRDMFAKGQAVLANGFISMSLTNFRELEDEFGILPYPKWDEAQEDYITMSDGSHEAMSIPKTVEALETVGIITEALNAESYKILVPAYYDVALKVKATRDEQSIEMLDRIVDSRMFDFGYVYDAWAGASFFLARLVRENNTNIESYYAERENSVTAHYNKVIEYFENY